MMDRARIQKLHDLNESGVIKRGHVIEMLNEIENLREWIRRESEVTDTCVFSILREICDGCQCKRKEPA